MAAAGQDVAEEVALLIGQRTDLSLVEELGEPEDRVERRAQLVRHVGEELRLVRAGPGELLRLPLRFREQCAQLGTAPGPLESDGQGLAHGSEQLRCRRVPGLQAGEFEDAGDPADAEQWNQRDGARGPGRESGRDPQLALGGVDDHDFGLQRGLSDETLAEAKAWHSVVRRERIFSQEAERAIRVQRVERADGAFQIAAEHRYGTLRHLPGREFAAKLLGQGRLSGLEPVDPASLGLEALEALRHLVRLPGEIAQLVAAGDGNGPVEVSLAAT